MCVSGYLSRTRVEWWPTFAWERSFVHAPGSLADWENARLRSLFSFLRFADMDVKRFKVVNAAVCFVSLLDTLPLRSTPLHCDDNDDDNANNTSCTGHCYLRNSRLRSGRTHRLRRHSQCHLHPRNLVLGRAACPHRRCMSSFEAI